MTLCGCIAPDLKDPSIFAATQIFPEGIDREINGVKCKGPLEMAFQIDGGFTGVFCSPYERSGALGLYLNLDFFAPILCELLVSGRTPYSASWTM